MRTAPSCSAACWSPYSVDGVDSPRLAGGLAGVIGVLVTLVVAGGIGYAVRRRRPETDDDAADAELHEDRA